MNTKFALGLVILGVTALTLTAGDLAPLSGGGRGDTNLEPIPPLIGDGTSPALDGFPGRDISSVAVPEPSTLSLLAGSAMLGAWFYFRRRAS